MVDVVTKYVTSATLGGSTEFQSFSILKVVETAASLRCLDRPADGGLRLIPSANICNRKVTCRFSHPISIYMATIVLAFVVLYYVLKDIQKCM